MDDLTLAALLIIIGFMVGWYSTAGHKTQLIRIGDIFLFSPLRFIIQNFYRTI